MKKIEYTPYTTVGNFVYVRETAEPSHPRKAVFLCPICKKEFTTTIYDVKYKNRKSCKKCSKRGINNNNYKHGFALTQGKRDPAYKVYYGMINRCYNIKSTSYYNYGGRGITICDRWLGKEGFVNFIEDIGIRPGKEYSIDRINVNGNYEPSNCKWTTAKEQSLNSRNGLNRSLSLLTEIVDTYPIHITTIEGYIQWVKEQINKFKLL